jgi:hypothetical protein
MTRTHARWEWPEASVETEVSFLVSSRRLGGMARDLSSVRLYHTETGQAYVAGVSGCRRSRAPFQFWVAYSGEQSNIYGREVKDRS